MKKLEPAIGEVFQIDSIVFVCEQTLTNDCIGCSMNHTKKYDYVCCDSNERFDGKSVRFKKIASIVPETYYNVEIKVTPKEDLKTILLKTIPSEKVLIRLEAIRNLFTVAEYVNEGKQVDPYNCYRIQRSINRFKEYEVFQTVAGGLYLDPLFVSEEAAQKAIEIMGDELKYCFI